MACLNDICLNGCIPLLFSNIWPNNADQIAILSTYDLHHIRYNTSDQILWKTMKHISFWTKNLWIIAIHWPSSGGHWVLCIMHLTCRELLLFDSLGERHPWHANVSQILFVPIAFD
jgi:Ulp1 family protease